MPRPANSSVLLRTMTERSILGFGKYAELTVREVLNLGIEGRALLVYYYYNKSMITFMPELLTELGITGELQLAKPGKDGRYMYKWKDATLSPEERLQLYGITQRDFKVHRTRAGKNNALAASKGTMQQKNHGRSS